MWARWYRQAVQGPCIVLAMIMIPHIASHTNAPLRLTLILRTGWLAYALLLRRLPRCRFVLIIAYRLTASCSILTVLAIAIAIATLGPPFGSCMFDSAGQARVSVMVLGLRYCDEW